MNKPSEYIQEKIVDILVHASTTETEISGLVHEEAAFKDMYCN